MYEYPFDYGGMEGEGGAVAVMLIFYLIYILVIIGISVAQYVLQSVGMYTIAKRRGIQHPWLSWLPVGNTWVLGCISDQYQYVVKGKVKNKRKALLILSVLSFVLVTVGIGMYIGAVVGLILENPEMPDSAVMEIMPTILAFMCAMLVAMGISIAASVITYMSLYDLYASCEPKNATLYLVLSIFISVTMPLFVFLCRKKDLGMPPRKSEPAQETWKSVEAPKEPWDNNPEV